MTRTTAWQVLGMAIWLAAACGPAGAQEADAGEGTDEAAGEAAADAAVERPGAWWHIREMVAVAGWHAGLISDTVVQIRGPLHRSKSMVFQDTYAGAGMRLAVTPAFVDVGPRISFAPFDFFDLDVQAGYARIWPSDAGLLPYDDIGQSTRDLDRKDRFKTPATGYEVEAGNLLYVSLIPTIKLKIGPIIAFDTWNVSFLWITGYCDKPQPLYYEPYRARLVERDDIVYQHQAAVLGEILPGGDGPLLWVGATYRDTHALRSGDRSIVVGGVVFLQPSYKRGWPKIVMQVLPYVKDPDRVGGVPALQGVLIWEMDPPVKKGDEVVAAIR